MSELVSVKMDPDTHGEGRLLASTNPNLFYINGKLLVTVESEAQPDNAGHTIPEVNSKTGSAKFFAMGLEVHRHNDLRYCDAQTVVEGQTKFFSG